MRVDLDALRYRSRGCRNARADSSESPHVQGAAASESKLQQEQHQQ